MSFFLPSLKISKFIFKSLKISISLCKMALPVYINMYHLRIHSCHLLFYLTAFVERLIIKRLLCIAIWSQHPPPLFPLFSCVLSSVNWLIISTTLFLSYILDGKIWKAAGLNAAENNTVRLISQGISTYLQPSVLFHFIFNFML